MHVLQWWRDLTAVILLNQLRDSDFFPADLDAKSPMSACFQKFGLDQNTTDFVGHALALHRDDEYEIYNNFLVFMYMHNYYTLLIIFVQLHQGALSSNH